MTIQEIEELQFAPQSESQNCLAEALPYAIAARGEIPVYGSGRFVITIASPIYCRATDGFAGMMTDAVHLFETRADLDAALNSWPHDGEVDYSITDPDELAAAAAARAAAAAAYVEDEIPF